MSFWFREVNWNNSLSKTKKKQKNRKTFKIRCLSLSVPLIGFVEYKFPYIRFK